LEQRAVIEFLIAENVKPVNIHRSLLVIYGNEALYILFVVGEQWVKGLEVGKAIIAYHNRVGGQ